MKGEISEERINENNKMAIEAAPGLNQSEL